MTLIAPSFRSSRHVVIKPCTLQLAVRFAPPQFRKRARYNCKSLRLVPMNTRNRWGCIYVFKPEKGNPHRLTVRAGLTRLTLFPGSVDLRIANVNDDKSAVSRSTPTAAFIRYGWLVGRVVGDMFYAFEAPGNEYVCRLISQGLHLKFCSLSH